MATPTTEDILKISGRRSAFSLPTRTVISASTQPKMRPMPVKAYHGQRTEEFDEGLHKYKAKVVEGHANFQRTQLLHFTLENASFVIHPGLDELIRTDDGDILLEPSCFCQPAIFRAPGRLPDMTVHDLALDEVFLGFDAAWTNYYHWLGHGISKTQVANAVLPTDVVMAVPDMERTMEGRSHAFTKETYHASLSLAGLENRITRLPNGLHRARKLHFFWHAPKSPELYHDTAAPFEHFDRIQVPRQPDLPRRFYVTREGGQDSRISPDEQTAVSEVIRKQHLEKVFLEKLDFATQVALFRQAEFILAPHGAGLVNMVFARTGTRLLELNRQLDSTYLRNCFYVITLQRQQPYSFLNLTQETLTAPMLDEAITRLNQAD